MQYLQNPETRNQYAKLMYKEFSGGTESFFNTQLQ
jgi:hypothetical protein